tara:strand:- start:180 stop:1139 length:960 start_codon:yes stop_codon:yes gene_type:complete
MSGAKTKLMKRLMSLASDAKDKPKKKQTEAEKKKIGGKERKITGVGALAEPQKGHLKQVKGKKGKVMDEQKQKGLDKPKMGDFARQQARGGKKAEGKMTPFQIRQREYEGLSRKAKIAEIAKGSKSKYYEVIKKIGKGFQKGSMMMKKKGMKAGGAMMMKRKKMASGGSGEGIDPKAIKTKGQFENLLAKGKLEHIPNAKLVDIAIKVGYITGDEMMGNAKGGAMMKKKGMAKGGMKKKGMAMGGLKKPAAGQTGLKKLPTPVRNKMGYMKKGGMKKKGMARGGMKKKGYAAGGMTVTYRVGGMAKGKSYGIVDNKKKK